MSAALMEKWGVVLSIGYLGGELMEAENNWEAHTATRSGISSCVQQLTTNPILLFLESPVLFANGDQLCDARFIEDRELIMRI